jgi:hypothetical protein
MLESIWPQMTAISGGDEAAAGVEEEGEASRAMAAGGATEQAAGVCAKSDGKELGTTV